MALTKVKAAFLKTNKLATSDLRPFHIKIQDTDTPAQQLTYQCQLQSGTGSWGTAIAGATVTLNPASPIADATTEQKIMGSLDLNNVAAGSYNLRCEVNDPYTASPIAIEHALQVIAPTITPATSSVHMGETQQFTCSSDALPQSSFTYSIQGTAKGTIDSNTGIYTAPSTGYVNGDTDAVICTATSAYNAKAASSASATATIQNANPVAMAATSSTVIEHQDAGAAISSSQATITCTATDSDAHDTTFTYAATLTATGSAGSAFSPSVVQIGTSNQFTYTAGSLPDGIATAVDTIQCTVTDPHGATATANVDITAVQDSSVPAITGFTSSNGLAFSPGDTTTVLCSGADVEINESLTYSITGATNGALSSCSIATVVGDMSTYSCTYTAPSVAGPVTDTLVCSVTDQHGNAGSNTMSMALTTQNNDPTITITNNNVDIEFNLDSVDNMAYKLECSIKDCAPTNDPACVALGNTAYGPMFSEVVQDTGATMSQVNLMIQETATGLTTGNYYKFECEAKESVDGMTFGPMSSPQTYLDATAWQA